MKKIAYGILIFSVLVFLLSVIVFSSGVKNLEVQTFFASVNVTDSAGFDLNGSALTFGNVAVPGRTVRNIVFSNEYDFPVIAKISSEGKISEILIFEDRVRVEKGEVKKIPFTAIADLDITEGLYSGEVKFIISPA